MRECVEEARIAYEIRFPRVEGYRQAIRSKITVDWASVATLTLDPLDIPPEVSMKAGLPSNRGRPSLTGPERLERVDLNPYRQGRRVQELVFELARDLTRDCLAGGQCDLPAHVLFPQVARVAERYLREKVDPIKPADVLDVFLAPYYGWVIERLAAAIRPDPSAGETPEVPQYETNRGPGSTADVDFRTTRPIREVVHSHVNYVVADTRQWEQAAAYVLDNHPMVEAFVKNAGLGFTVPYFHNGQAHDYEPDFIVRLNGDPPLHLILETKGYDIRKEVKAQAAQRWVDAVNAEGSYGYWKYAVAEKVGAIEALVCEIIAGGSTGP